MNITAQQIHFVQKFSLDDPGQTFTESYWQVIFFTTWTLVVLGAQHLEAVGGTMGVIDTDIRHLLPPTTSTIVPAHLQGSEKVASMARPQREKITNNFQKIS